MAKAKAAQVEAKADNAAAPPKSAPAQGTVKRGANWQRYSAEPNAPILPKGKIGQPIAPVLASPKRGGALIAVLGVGKGSWGHVARLIAESEWGRIVLLSNEWGQEKFKPPKECEWIMVNNRAGFEVIKDEIKNNLPEGKLSVSLISGSGKEHMALLAALKEAGRDYELIVLTGDGTKSY
ncbi:MAG: hypothetical protein V1676_01500 [Candidatus Diapherotrites archaeon]